MKPCRVTVNGNRYIVSKYGVVSRVQTDMDIAGYYGVDICDTEESQMVIKEVKRIRAKRNRQARHEAYLSCGMVKVRGSLGGTYYE